MAVSFTVCVKPHLAAVAQALLPVLSWTGFRLSVPRFDYSEVQTFLLAACDLVAGQPQAPR